MTDRPGPDLTREAIFENSFRTVYSAVGSTMLRPHGIRYRTQGMSGAVDCAEDFLVNSRIRRDAREFELSVESFFFDAIAVSSSMVGAEPVPEQGTVALPAGFDLGMSLGDAMARRRSQRRYTGDRISLTDLATVVRSAGGVTAQGDVEHLRGGRTTINFRVTPSGGALYPVEVWVAVLHAAGVDRGIYRYSPLADRLVPASAVGSVDDLLAAFCGGDEVINTSQSAMILLLVARPWRAMRKYGPRGLRHVLLETGQIAQNAHLAAVALGLGSVDCSSIYDDEAHEVLGIDGRYEFVAHTVVVGHVE